MHRDLPADTQVKKLSSNGTFFVVRVTYKVDGRRAFEQVLVIADGDNITVTDLHGDILIEQTRPTPGITYVGQRQTRRHASQDSVSVTEVLRQRPSLMS